MVTIVIQKVNKYLINIVFLMLLCIGIIYEHTSYKEILSIYESLKQDYLIEAVNIISEDKEWSEYELITITNYSGYLVSLYTETILSYEEWCLYNLTVEQLLHFLELVSQDIIEQDRLTLLKQDLDSLYKKYLKRPVAESSFLVELKSKSY